MTNEKYKQLITGLAGIITLLVAAFIISMCELRKEADSVKQLNAKLAQTQIYSPLTVDTIRDSIPVYTSDVVNIDRSAYKKEFADKKLLKEMGISPSQVTEHQLTETIIRDTVILVPQKDSVYTYSDQWSSFRLSLRDSSLAYSVRDSITTLVAREYKHRFLWWKWGTKGYKVKVVNFNPHSTLLYNQYIKVN